MTISAVLIVNPLELHQHLWYNYLIRNFKADHKLGSKTKNLWENPQYREHMRRAHLGQIAWNKGIKTGLIPKTAFKINDERLLNENHHAWKGNKVGYHALHNWIKRKLGVPQKCVNGHIAKRYYWGNISGEYKRDFSDWYELCWKCNHTDGVPMAERFKK